MNFWYEEYLGHLKTKPLMYFLNIFASETADRVGDIISSFAVAVTHTEKQKIDWKTNAVRNKCQRNRERKCLC